MHEELPYYEQEPSRGELSLDDISFAARAAMGARMEMAVAPARLERFGQAMMKAARVTGHAIVGDGFSLAAIFAPGAAHLFHNRYQQMLPEQQPPADEA